MRMCMRVKTVCNLVDVIRRVIAWNSHGHRHRVTIVVHTHAGMTHHHCLMMHHVLIRHLTRRVHHSLTTPFTMRTIHAHSHPHPHVHSHLTHPHTHTHTHIHPHSTKFLVTFSVQSTLKTQLSVAVFSTVLYIVFIILIQVAITIA